MNSRQPYSLRNQLPLLSQQISRPSDLNRRPKPISGLHAQFEELKKKIRDVQNKNQRIIQKIHNAFNFKKKGAYVQDNQEYVQDERKNNQISGNYYERVSPIKLNSYKSEENPKEFDSRSRKTIQNQDQKRIHQKITIQDDLQNYQMLNPRLTDNSSKSPLKNLYKTQGLPLVSKESAYTYSKSPDLKSVNQQSTKSVQQRVQHYSNMQFEETKNHQLEAVLDIEKKRYNDLLKQYRKKQEQINRLIHIDQRFRNFSETSRIVFQSALANLMQSVIRNQLGVLQKGCKKNQLRLLNLSVMLREAHQDHKSTKVIKQHRRRRSNSRSARKIDKEGKITSRSQLSKSQVKTQQSAKKSKQFQQIVGKYQHIIRAKNEEIQNLDKKLKIKQQQCMEFKTKLQNFIKKAKHQSYQHHSINHNQNNLLQEQYKTKINEQQLIILQERSKIKVLSKKLEEVENSLNQKDILCSQLKQINSSIEGKISSLKNCEKSNQINQNNLDKLQKQLQSKSKTLTELQQNTSQLEKKIMEKECELYGIGNKLKKCQQMLQVKQKKIQQLEKLLRNSEEILDKSIYVEQSMGFSRIQNRSDELKRILEQNQKLQQQIQNLKNQVFSIMKEKQLKDKKIVQLEQKIVSFKKKIQKLQQQCLEKSENTPPYSQQQEQQQKIKLEEELMQASQKCNNFAKMIQNLRTQNLEVSSKCIKVESQLDFSKETMKEKQAAVEKYKKQNEQLRNKILKLQKLLSKNEEDLQIERKLNEEKIHQLQKQWEEFEENMKNQPDQFNERKSQMSIVNFKSNYNQITTQNEYLTEKLKEAQITIETHNIMEEKIISQYRINVEKVKTQLKERISAMDKITNQLEKSKKKMIQLEIQLKEKQTNQDGDENLKERITELENELQETKDINDKLTEMTKQLFEQVTIKQAENCEYAREIQIKNFRILELQQLAELQGGSRISSKSHYRQSIKSQVIRQSYVHDHSHIQIPNEGTMQLDVSVDQSFLDNSHLNVSQLFREIPHEKLKLKKREHKLFEKTGQYINSLKESLEEKCKKIRILQKKIQSLKSSELVRKNYDLSGKQPHQDDDDDEGEFKDYESVQLENRKGGHHRRFKMLENDTKLVVEQNNMLRQQIQTLEEQVEKAEEQQNSLVKIKDLYKDEIKKLIKKSEQQTKMYEQQLQKQRARYEDSESVHNFNALKQLFIKAGSIMGVNGDNKKKQTNKKELEQYIKVMSNILKLEQSEKDQIIKNIRN